MTLSNKQPITIVQGAQYGSEAKGLAAAYLCETEGVDVAVRTGAVNAGHTVVYKGRTVKLQQLPVGFVNPNTFLVVGAGALVHLDILRREVKLLSEVTGTDIKDRLMIDYNAGIHDDGHTARSAISGRHVIMGATGKGSSEALVDKIKGRSTGYKTFGKLPYITDEFNVGNTAVTLNQFFDHGKKILLEATQGTLLDLHFGPYPYVTHKPTTPANWLAEAGLSPALPTDIVSVVRTYPIRVAGNSGHMPNEISWPILAREVNLKLLASGKAPLVADSAIATFEESVTMVATHNQMAHDRNLSAGFTIPAGSNGNDQHEWEDRYKYRQALSDLNSWAIKSLPVSVQDELSKFFEFTTVTLKPRRVSRLSLSELAYSSMLVRPHRVFLTFMNYEFPDKWFSEGHAPTTEEIRYIRQVESTTNAVVSHVSYGPESKHTAKFGTFGG